MSKLYEKYLELKNLNPSNLYLFKSGIFYIFLDEDAKKISPILNLKLNKLNENILKCGFPVNSLQKYISMLKNTNLDFRIIDNISNPSPNRNSNVSNTLSTSNQKNLKKFLNKISNIDIDNLSIREVYSFLDSISKEANIFLKYL